MQRNLEQILNTILRSSELLEDEIKQESELKNLTARQLYCIELVKELKNPTLSELADTMRIAKASMSVMIDRLEKNGFIHRVASDSDRRTAHVHLTEKGEKAALIHTELHKRISAFLTADMTESEKEILVVILNKSVNSLANMNNYFKLNY